MRAEIERRIEDYATDMSYLSGKLLDAEAERDRYREALERIVEQYPNGTPAAYAREALYEALNPPEES